MKCLLFPKLSSQLLINSYKPKHEVARNSLFNVFSMTSQLRTNKFNLINIVKKCRNFFAKIFKDFAQFLTNHHFWGCACTAYSLSSYTTGLYCKKPYAFTRKQAEINLMKMSHKTTCFNKKNFISQVLFTFHLNEKHIVLSCVTS